MEVKQRVIYRRDWMMLCIQNMHNANDFERIMSVCAGQADLQMPPHSSFPSLPESPGRHPGEEGGGVFKLLSQPCIGKWKACVNGSPFAMTTLLFWPYGWVFW